MDRAFVGQIVSVVALLASAFRTTSVHCDVPASITCNCLGTAAVVPDRAATPGSSVAGWIAVGVVAGVVAAHLYQGVGRRLVPTAGRGRISY